MALKLKRYGPLNTVWIEKVAILAAQWGWTRTQNETDLHKVIGKKENLHWTNITSFGVFWVRRERGVNRTSKERSKNRSWKLSGDVQEDDHKGEISQIKIRYEFCWKFSFTPPAAYLPNICCTPAIVSNLYLNCGTAVRYHRAGQMAKLFFWPLERNIFTSGSQTVLIHGNSKVKSLITAMLLFDGDLANR